MIQATTAPATGFGIDPMLLLPLVLLGAMLFFMWRGNKKRAAQQQEMRTQMVVGADVMTQAGIFGTIVDQDTDNNVTTIETTPGVLVRVHSATVINVVTPTVPDDASALADTPADDRITSDPATTDAELRADRDRDLDDEPIADADRPTDASTDAKGDGTDPLGDYRGDTKA